MKHTVTTLILIISTLYCTYAQNTDFTDLSNQEINNLVGVWIETIESNSNELPVNKQYKKEFTWGTGLYIPNFSLCIDYDRDNAKCLVLVDTTLCTEKIIITKIEKSSGSNEYKLYIEFPDAEGYQLMEKYTMFSIFYNESRYCEIDLTNTWLFGAEAGKSRWYHLSGPSIH